ncbi:hypothetical protein J2S19_000821 [Metabacillus malikii]|uniref:Uncharacterized protein n=1 Tax=Metabacillus malikii TaxID=1504265 RepID=A0ABT9ZBC7_9BACI|nr:hypothetical protein [Metabacillus malikii]
MDMYSLILIIAIVFGFSGSIYIITKNYLRFGIIFIIHTLLASCLCMFFYWAGFYRFIFPLPFILPAVILNFGFLVLATIYFRPKKFTFPFYFIVINWTFSIEIILKKIGFIIYINEWDYWDSYSLYWIYLRFFSYIGDYIISNRYRRPIRSDRKPYWIIFLISIIITFFCITYLAYLHKLNSF